MPTKSQAPALFRGRRMRVTRVNATGRPIIGDNNAAVSKGMAVVSYTTLTEEGEAISSTNANGETCLNEPGTPSFNGFGVEVEFCRVDFSLFELMTGQKVVLNSEGRIVGITESTKIDLTAVNLALEVWTGANVSGTLSETAAASLGYVLTPFLGGGVVGDISIENAGINFTITGMTTKNGSNWGAGPYAVELVDGVAAPLFEPIVPDDHRRILYTEVAPPPAVDGYIPVLDPTDPELTGITATPTGLSVDIDPLPAGTDPVLYDFGDGEWDYAETGSYTHVYPAAGTYTITGTRGASTVTTDVTVAAV